MRQTAEERSLEQAAAYIALLAVTRNLMGHRTVRVVKSADGKLVADVSWPDHTTEWAFLSLWLAGVVGQRIWRDTAGIVVTQIDTLDTEAFCNMPIGSPFVTKLMSSLPRAKFKAIARDVTLTVNRVLRFAPAAQIKSFAAQLDRLLPGESAVLEAPKEMAGEYKVTISGQSVLVRDSLPEVTSS
jgi:hypothetical protein